MSTPIAFCELEEQLSGPNAAHVADEIAQQLEGLSARLREARSSPRSPGDFADLMAAQLAVNAASEVISAVRPEGRGRQAHPLRDAPEYIRSFKP